jgi:hypothetical protein
MYPQDWADQAENFADKQGLGSDRLGKDEQIAVLKSRLQKPNLEPSKKQEMEQALAALEGGEESQPSGIGQGVSTLRGKVNKQGKSYEKNPITDPELSNKIVGRKQAATSRMHRLFRDFPIEDVLRYAKYFSENPQELEQAKRDRVGPPPQSMQDITGNIEGPDARSEIGSDTESTLLQKADKERARKDFATQQTAFNKKKAGEDSAPSRDIKPAGLDYQPNEAPDYKEIFKSLMDVGAYEKRTKSGKPASVNPMTQKMVDMFAKKTGRPSGDVIDVLNALLDRDAKGEIKGLKKPTEAIELDEDDLGLAHELYKALDMKRLGTKASAADPLRSAMTDYGKAEQEKVGANIPARDYVRGMEKDVADKASARKGEELAAEKEKRIDPEQLAASQRSAAGERDKLLAAMAKRAEELETEKGALGSEIDQLAGGEKPEDLKASLRDIDSLKGTPQYDELSDTRDSISKGLTKAQNERSFKYIAQQIKRLNKALAGVDPEKEPEKKQAYEQRLSDLKKRMRPVQMRSAAAEKRPGETSPLAYRLDKELGDLPKKPYAPPGLSPEKKTPTPGLTWPSVPEPKDEEKPFDSPSGEVVSGNRTVAGRKRATGDAAFKYGRESSADVNKKLVMQLVKAARDSLAKQGQELSPENVMNFIKSNFESNRFPEKFDSIKDFMMTNPGLVTKHGVSRDVVKPSPNLPDVDDSEQKQQNLAKLRREKQIHNQFGKKSQRALPRMDMLAKPNHFEKEEMSNESINSKSLLELLTDIGSNEDKHAKAQQRKDGWDKAPPAKKLNLVPKWKKSKMTLEELFTGEDEE